MEILGNKDQGFSVLSQHASWEPVQKPEENSCICKTNQANEIILGDCRHCDKTFCEWSLPLLNTPFISMEKSKNKNLSCFFEDQSRNSNPSAQTEVCHNPSWPGEGGRGKSKLSSPFPPHFCLIIPSTALKTCGLPEQSLPQRDFTASLPPLWPNTDVLKQHFTFYKKHRPKYKPCEYIMRQWGHLPSSCTHSSLLSFRVLKPRAQPKISWHLKESRFAVLQRNTSLCLFCCPATPYQ